MNYSFLNGGRLQVHSGPLRGIWSCAEGIVAGTCAEHGHPGRWRRIDADGTRHRACDACFGLWIGASADEVCEAVAAAEVELDRWRDG